MTAALDSALPASLEAAGPPEARGVPRDGVRMLVSHAASGTVAHHRFTDLPRLLLPGDLLVVNTSRTLPAAVPADDPGLAVHFSTGLPDGTWLVELRTPQGKSSIPNDDVVPPEVITLPGNAKLTLAGRETARLWRARLSTAVVPYLLRHGEPIRYSYAAERWPLRDYQTVFGRSWGSAEMPSAGRPFTPLTVTEIVARGVTIAPVTLHCGVSSLEAGEDPYPEQYDVPPATARLVNLTRQSGGRVIAVGTTVVRALETAARAPAGPGPSPSPGSGSSPGSSPDLGPSPSPGSSPDLGLSFSPSPSPSPSPDPGLRPEHKSEMSGIRPGAGWTSLVVSPEIGLRAVDGLLTGLHEPRSSHLRMLAAFHGPDLLDACYDAALSERYLWHEFGDVHLLMP